MTAAYDTYDYPSYWQNRDYEHESEVIAIREFLKSIAKIEKIIEVGAGYGRLTPQYSYRAKRIVLVDPSQKLLNVARERLKTKNISFIKGTVQELPENFKRHEFDVAIMVRVMHHITDPDMAIAALSEILRPGGYLILEFANKNHGKALFSNILKGNFTYPIDIFPTDKKTTKNANNKTIPFLNYHPDVIYETLRKNRFRILKRRSVSNIRSTYLKKHIPLPVLLSLEKILQKNLASAHFGPSIFVLARKRG
jgi:ubiquinone/menaquinone biosynthesis C-methylase UbiE